MRCKTVDSEFSRSCVLCAVGSVTIGSITCVGYSSCAAAGDGSGGTTGGSNAAAGRFGGATESAVIAAVVSVIALAAVA